MSTWMYAIHELEDAINNYNIECTFGCNKDAVHAWGEPVAFYNGPNKGLDGSDTLLYSIADTRCQKFGTYGAGGDSIKGVARTNLNIYAQPAAQKNNLLSNFYTRRVLGPIIPYWEGGAKMPLPASIAFWT
eukprot:3170005-Ditylum_brightwellii.AAC.1